MWHISLPFTEPQSAIPPRKARDAHTDPPLMHADAGFWFLVGCWSRRPLVLCGKRSLRTCCLPGMEPAAGDGSQRQALCPRRTNGDLDICPGRYVSFHGPLVPPGTTGTDSWVPGSRVGMDPDGRGPPPRGPHLHGDRLLGEHQL